MNRTAAAASLLLLAIGGGVYAQSTPTPSDPIRAARPFRAIEHRGADTIGAVALSVDDFELRPLLAPGRSRVERFPLELGLEVDLELEPIRVMRPGVRGVAVGAGGVERPVASVARLWRGRVVGDPESRVFLSDSPAGLFGWVRSGEREFIVSSGDPLGERIPVVFDARGPAAAAIAWTPFTCAVDEIDQPAARLAPPALPGDAPQQGGIAGSGLCRTITLAIETDEEFLGRFGGSVVSAQAYIETLVAATNEIFVRDTEAQFEIVFSRLWTTTDPWDAGSTSAQLTEFRNHWITNMGHVPRNLAHFLSGRGLGGGVAWLNALCGSHGYAVSANLNGSFPTPLVNHSHQNWDIVVFAHELGHNVGTWHTHDTVQYNPPLDDCYTSSGLGPCTMRYGGTIMSYCHQCSGGLSNIVLQFHPQVQQAIRTYVAGRPCLVDQPCGGGGDECPEDPYHFVDSGCGCGSITIDYDGDGTLDCDGMIVDLGSFTLAGGGTATVDLSGLGGSIGGFAIQFTFGGGGSSWASDLLLGLSNGSAGVQAGGFDQSFGFDSLGVWSFDGQQSASAGPYKDGKSATLALGPGGTAQVLIRNGWGDSAAVSYSNVRLVLYGVEPLPACPADFTGDGVVDGGDLGLLLLQWLQTTPAYDLNGDGVVDGGDIGMLLLQWGPCPK